jgi:hypothetical protein
MSNQANLVYLREKISALIPKERSGWVVFILGLVAAVVGFWLKPLGAENGTALGILGAIVCIVGLINILIYGAIHLRLLKLMDQIALFEQLTSLSVAELKCPSCGSEIPHDSLGVCPSCGACLLYG